MLQAWSMGKATSRGNGCGGAHVAAEPLGHQLDVAIGGADHGGELGDGQVPAVPRVARRRDGPEVTLELGGGASCCEVEQQIEPVAVAAATGVGPRVRSGRKQAGFGDHPSPVVAGARIYYTILYYTMIYYNILYYTILFCTILYYTILY